MPLATLKLETLSAEEHEELHKSARSYLDKEIDVALIESIRRPKSRRAPKSPEVDARLLELTRPVSALMKSAAVTLRQIPQGRYVPSFGSERSPIKSAWPDVVREAYDYVELVEPRLVPGSKEISRMDRALSWLLWLDERERKIVWGHACGLSYRKLGHMFKRSHVSIRSDHITALLKIALHLLNSGLQI